MAVMRDMTARGIMPDDHCCRNLLNLHFLHGEPAASLQQYVVTHGNSCVHPRPDGKSRPCAGHMVCIGN